MADPKGWKKCDVEEKWLRAVYGDRVLGYEVLKVADINPDDARNTRLSAGADESEITEDYVAAMKDGQPFPALVVLKRKGHYDIAGGRHRYRAAKAAKLVTVWALTLADLNEVESLKVSTKLNQFNGRRESRDSIIRRAVYLVVEQKQPSGEIAEFFTLPRSSLEKAVRVEKFRQSMLAASIDLTQVPIVHVEAIASVESKPVQKALAQMVRGDAKITATRLKEHIADIRELSNEGRKLAHIAALTHEAGVPRHRISTRVENLARYIREAAGAVDAVCDLSDLPPMQYSKLIDDYTKLQAGMTRLGMKASRKAS